MPSENTLMDGLWHSGIKTFLVEITEWEDSGETGFAVHVTRLGEGGWTLSDHDISDWSVEKLAGNIHSMMELFNNVQETSDGN
jgi:hypothetical protein